MIAGIIPYIASDYKKDKIWLRRNKASRREYQVVLAIGEKERGGRRKKRD